ncbi:hypothetical protein GCM10029976_066130 [Kribbella albertanoniae]|uniref:ParB/Sulfiredoxin domain-containing protein n=1 Tax=Kribbella albertanoniae TaxID=1266829 RepID=A0A4V2XPK1_9ACTN|nr:hypothetical protein [Kribbella albertanoniae]TDC22345.1 hypothetical protein E1261_31110 [Kribbella albertanoniae]
MKPFPLPIPPVLRPYILDFLWDVDRLHALELPTAELTVASLAHHLDLPFWAYGGRPFQVTPHEVAADPNRYHEQYARTLAADLSHPIDAVRREDGRITILDGIHRLLHAELTDQPVITARLLDWAHLDDIASYP